MFNLMEDVPNETFDVVDTPAEAFEQSNNRQKHLFPGKTPWKIKCLSKTPVRAGARK